MRNERSIIALLIDSGGRLCIQFRSMSAQLSYMFQFLKNQSPINEY